MSAEVLKTTIAQMITSRVPEFALEGNLDILLRLLRQKLVDVTFEGFKGETVADMLTYQVDDNDILGMELRGIALKVRQEIRGSSRQ